MKKMEELSAEYAIQINGTSGNFTDDITYAFEAGYEAAEKLAQRQIQEDFKAGWDARDKLDNEALKIAVEALEFYAEVSSWYINGSPKYLNHILDSDLQMANEPQPFSDQKGPFVGGKSARSALAEIRKLIGEK